MIVKWTAQVRPRAARIVASIALASAVALLASGCGATTPTEGRWTAGGADAAEFVLDGDRVILRDVPIADPNGDALECAPQSLPRVSGEFDVYVGKRGDDPLRVDVAGAGSPWPASYIVEFAPVGPPNDPWKVISTPDCGPDIAGGMTLHRQ